MTDYTALLDDEVWAYIRRVDAFYPPDAVDLSIEGQREVYDAMCAEMRQPRPPQVEVTEGDIGGVPCRRYEVGNSDTTVIYYHGGGFVVGGLDSHDDVCAEICARTGYRVISVDYPLAPEHPFPACFDASWAAFDAVQAEHPGPVILSGDSAGGNLAAAVAHKARMHAPGRIAGQVLIYPGLGGDTSKGSYITHADAPHLTTRDMAFYRKVRSGGQEPPEGDPTYAPLHDSDFTGLPPTLIVTVECDPLSSDGEAYCDAIRAAGGQAEWVEEKGLVHGCLRARVMSARAAAFFDGIVDGIAAMGKTRAG